MKHLLHYFRQLIIEMPNEYWPWANQYLKLKRDRIRVKRAIKVADLKTSMDRKRRWVLRDWNDMPVALTRSEIAVLQRRGQMNKHITILDLDRESLYHTKTQNHAIL